MTSPTMKKTGTKYELVYRHQPTYVLGRFEPIRMGHKTVIKGKK